MCDCLICNNVFVLYSKVITVFLYDCSLGMDGGWLLRKLAREGKRERVQVVVGKLKGL